MGRGLRWGIFGGFGAGRGGGSGSVLGRRDRPEPEGSGATRLPRLLKKKLKGKKRSGAGAGERRKNLGGAGMTKKNRIKQNPPRVWNDPTSHPKKGGEVGLEALGSDRGAGAAAGRG